MAQTPAAAAGTIWHRLTTRFFFDVAFGMALLREIGRFGQLLGLGIPVFAMILQLNGRILPSQMLVMLVAAVCLFGIGRILEGFART